MEVALLEGFHFESIDAVDDAVELILQLRLGLDVDAARQHEIDGAVEVDFGVDQVSLAIGCLALGVSLLNLLDEQTHALLLGGGRRRRWRRRSLLGLLWCWNCRRGGLRLRIGVGCVRLRRCASG